MSTATATTANVDDNTIEVINGDESTGIVITQDSTDTTTGQHLSQDTINSADYEDSQEQNDMKLNDINDGTTSRRRMSLSDDNSTEFVATTTHPLLPPPLLVKCPDEQDVLLPIEGYVMWPGNVRCNNILEQYQSKFVESSNNKEHQAQVILTVIQIVQQQQSTSTEEEGNGGGRFLKAIQVPSRQHKQTKSSDKKDDPNRFNLHTNIRDTIVTKTIWEVVYERDILIQLSKTFLLRTGKTCANVDATSATGTEKWRVRYSVNEESQISTSSMAILQGLYYVPNYYPNKIEKGPHEYDSCSDAESVVTSYSTADDDNNVRAVTATTTTTKKRRLIHDESNDFVPVSKSKATSSATTGITNVSNATGGTSLKATSSNLSKPTGGSVSNATGSNVSNTIGSIAIDAPINPQLATNSSNSSQPNTVSMIGRIINSDDDCTSQVVPAAAAAAAVGTPTTIEKADNNKANFHYKPKSMKSQLAMIEQEGSDNLPKGVTVRPSGKWQAQTYFAGQSRYVGVYDTSRLAARAYNVVQDYLLKYRNEGKVTKDSPRDELAAVFADARRVADEAVLRLRKDLNMADASDDQACETSDMQQTSPFEKVSITDIYTQFQPENSNTFKDDDTTNDEATTSAVTDTSASLVHSPPP